MKILSAGDLHFNKTQFKWLADQKESCDCLCLMGDLLDIDSGNFKKQSEWVSDWLKRYDKQIVVCSGNHDLDWSSDCSWLTDIKSEKICRDNQIKTINEIKFGCIPYLGADLSQFHDCDVLVTHVPPLKTATSQTMLSGRLKDLGDEDLYNALKERIICPRYILCGHVEKPSANRDRIFGVEIINPGAQHKLSVPNHQIIVI